MLSTLKIEFLGLSIALLSLIAQVAYCEQTLETKSALETAKLYNLNGGPQNVDRTIDFVHIHKAQVMENHYFRLITGIKERQYALFFRSFPSWQIPTRGVTFSSRFLPPKKKTLCMQSWIYTF